MNYRIKRGGQEFGPYDLTGLQSYVRSGQIAATDLAQSEGMTDWVPVQQILGDIPLPSPVPSPAWPTMAPAGANPYGAAIDPNQQLVPLPPNLHWGLLLVLQIFTYNVFGVIWAFVQANWARKLCGRNTPIVLAAMYPAGIVAGLIADVVGTTQNQPAAAFLGSILILAGGICLLAAAFSVRGAMESYYNSVENIGLSMSGVMVFFFNTIYIQYHINRITRWRRTGVLSA